MPTSPQTPQADPAQLEPPQAQDSQPSAAGAAQPAPEGENGGNALPPDTFTTLAGPVDAVEASAPSPGELNPLSDEPPDPQLRALPAALAGRLNQRELRTVWFMVSGKSYQEALTAAGIPKRASLRDSAPPPQVIEAADWLVRDLALQCGLSRKWILTQTVALYRRAVQAEPVLDRKGRPTGDWRMDGATAARCLELLGKAEGVFSAKSGPSAFTPDAVAQLLAAVERRGKPSLAERLVGSSSAAPEAAPARVPVESSQPVDSTG